MLVERLQEIPRLCLGDHKLLCCASQFILALRYSVATPRSAVASRTYQYGYTPLKAACLWRNLPAGTKPARPWSSAAPLFLLVLRMPGCELMSYHIMSYHVISYHVISCHIISCHIMSYHIGHLQPKTSELIALIQASVAQKV